MSKRNRWSESRAREVLAQADASGLSDVEFARRRGLRYERLRRWRLRLRMKGVGAAPLEFAEIVASRRGIPDAGGGGRIEVVLTNGRRVLVPRDVETERLPALLRALESVEC
jgi:hypothetical protein